MANIPAPPPPPPPPPPFNQNEHAVGEVPVPQKTTQTKEELSPVSQNEIVTGKSALLPAQLRQLSKNWSLAGDSGLLLYLNDFSQRIISKTTEIDKLVDSLGGSTKGCSAKVHNTFNDFLMLSSNQFIENRVYDEEINEEKAGKDLEEKIERTREQLEAEILPRYTDAVVFGLNVLEDAFITVEIKAQEEDSEDEDDDTSIHATVNDPIIEPKDVYSNRPLPHLIGTAEFLHDETLGLIELQSDEEEKKEDKDSEEESETETSEEEPEEESSEEDISSSEEESEEEKKPTKKVAKQKAHIDSEESDEDLFGEPKVKKKYVESESDDEEMPSENEEEEEEQEVKPKQINFQAELASKLGLAKPPPVQVQDEDSDTWDTDSIQQQDETSSIASRKRQQDTQSISSRRSTRSKSKRESKEETQSISSNKKERRDRTKSIESHRSAVRSDSTSKKKKKKKQAQNEVDEDLFAPPKTDDFFNEDDDGPFAKKSGGLFSGGAGNSLFDDEEDLFGDTKVEDTEKKEEVKDVKPEKSHRARTTSSGKKIPAGAVSIFGDSDSLFGSPKKQSPGPASLIPVSPSSKKAPPVVKGLFDEDEDEDHMFASAKASNEHLNVKPSTSPRKRTLELESEDDDMFGEKKISDVIVSKENLPKHEAEIKKKIPVGGVSMFGGNLPAALKKKSDVKNEEVEQSVKATSNNNNSGGGLFSDEDEDDLFNTSSNKVKTKPDQNVTTKTKPDESNKRKKTIISLFDDDDEDNDDEDDDDIFAGLSKASSTSQKINSTSTTPSKGKTTTASLFDDDDDLFAIPPKTTITKAPTKQDSKTSKSDVSTPIAPVKERSKSKSNIPNDNLFGDDDELFSSKFNASSVKSNDSKLTSNASEKAEVKKKPLDPFGDDDDDDDDLFAAPTTKQSIKKLHQNVVQTSINATESNMKPSTDTKPLEGPKKSTKSGIFDDDDDDLFSSPKGKTAQPESTKSPQEQPTIGEKEDTISSVSATVEDETDSKPKKPIGGVSMFGGIDPFAAKKNLKKSGKSDIFGSDESVDDMFSTKKTTTPKVTPSRPSSQANSSKPRPIPNTKPIANKSEASFDPLSALGGSDEPVVKSINKPSPPTVLKSSPKLIKRSIEKPAPPVSPKNSPKPIKDPGEDDVKKTPSAIGKLQASLNFNPSALLPGAAPPKKEVLVTNVTFDEPAQAKTLENVSKTRARGQAKRRPPTRKSRQPTSGSSDTTDSISVTESVRSTQPVADISTDKLPSLPDLAMNLPNVNLSEAADKRKSMQSSDIFADRDDIDNIPSVTKAADKPKSLRPSDIFAGEDEDELFTSQSNTTKTKSDFTDSLNEQSVNNQKQKTVTEPGQTNSEETTKRGEINDQQDSGLKNSLIFDDDDDDIFSSTSKNDMFSSPNRKADSKKDLFADDDLFNNVSKQSNQSNTTPVSKPSSILPTPTIKTEPSPSIISGPAEKIDSPSVEDDIFAIPDTTTKAKSSLIKDNDLFLNDDTDIFSSTETATKVKERNSANAPVIGNLPSSNTVSQQVSSGIKVPDDLEEDDLFSSAKPRKREISKSKQKTVKKQTDDDLFGASGSIFDDLPTSSKTKEKKKRKKKTEASEDIFATTASTEDIFAPKKTKTKKKTEKTTPKTNVLSDDAASIFDDPLNALGGE